jgi:hypothetical protein
MKNLKQNSSVRGNNLIQSINSKGRLNIQHQAAGILPIIKINNNIYFILGRENASNDLNKSHKFSDFGGHKDANETFDETAIREFDEESMGVLFNKIKLQKIILSLPYYFNKNTNYVTFLLKMKYKPDIITTYNKLLKKLKLCNYTCSNGLLEKTELKLFTINEILNNKKEMRKEFFESFGLFIKNIKI